MPLSLIIEAVLALAALVLIGFAVSTLIQVRKTLLNFDLLIKSTGKQLGPLLDDTHLMIRQVNAELDNIDDIVTNIRDVGDKVNATTRLANELISSPLIKIASISAGTLEAFKKLVGK